MTPSRHALRIALLTIFAAALLGKLAAGTQVMYADGLRFIASARALDQGDWSGSVVRAVDHPAYPIAIAAAHRLLGISDDPEGWQIAAQIVSTLAGAALVTPLYLVALELFGPATAWLACLLTFLVPTTGRILGDVLSEGLFLLAWTWGVWFALRFFRAGSLRWLPPMVGCVGIAYLTRPEGLLLPVALATTLMLAPLKDSWRLPRPVWLRASAIVVIGPMLAIGPYVVAKGGFATKPAVARLLGTAPSSTATAVERERPLDPEESPLKTFATAWRGMFRAVQGAVTTPLLILAAIGLLRRSSPTDSGRSRGRLFVATYSVLWMLALVRLYATGGYCTPRHSLILALTLITVAAHGLVRIGERLAARLKTDAGEWTRGLVSMGGVALIVCVYGPQTLAPINAESNGYRQAAAWIASHSNTDAKVLDLKGWALYYADRPGYSFTNYMDSGSDAEIRYVVAHDAFLIGEWPYCQTIRDRVGDRRPTVSFPEHPRKGVSRVHVFDLTPSVADANDAETY